MTSRLVNVAAPLARHKPEYPRTAAWRRRSLLAVGLLALGLALPSEAPRAQSQAPLSYTESDPRALGWMQGFPPPADRVVAPPMSAYFAFPRLRWSVCHLRELQATRRIARGGPVSPLPERLDAGIDAVTFVPLGGTAPMTWREALAANYTDGVIVLHRGRVVYEYYAGCLERGGRHAAASVTKSFVGLIAEVLVAEGVIDETATVPTYVPELADGAFATATVRQVMDMTTALEFSENYADPDADIWRYSAAGDPTPKPADYRGPRNYYAFLQTLRQRGEHGKAFAYKSVNTDVLAWIIARASGRDVVAHFETRLFEPLGFEQEGDMLIDSIGTPLAAGGMSLALRDAARVGQLMLQDGRWGGEQILPAAAIASIRGGGDREKFTAAGYDTLAGGSYRSMWWVLHNAHGAYTARGIHGQAIYVDPAADMVIARFASHPVSFNAAIDPTSLPAYQALAEYLLRRAD